MLVTASLAMLAFGPRAFEATSHNNDFAAYYCAGVVANDGRDIYLTEPLRTCENRVRSGGRRASIFVMPAPLPAYNVGIFRLVAMLPFAVASWLWFVLMCSVGLLAILITIRLGELAPIVAFAGMAFSVLLSAIIGQQVLISILGILLLAWAFASDLPWLAFLGAPLAATEPHLGAFAICAVLFWGTPRMRIAIVVAGVALLTVSLALQPVRLSAEYVRFVLPMHALSEIDFVRQYSLAYALHGMGVKEADSVHAAEFVFATLFAAALAGVARIRRALTAEIAIVGPSALLLVTGPFVHITQLAIAEPAALLLWSRTRRPEFAWAALLLAIPWIEFLDIFMLAPLIVAALTILGFRLVKIRPTYGIFVGALVVFMCTGLGLVLADGPSHALVHTSARAASFAEVSWREEVDLFGSSQPLVALLLKAPTFAGLLLMGWSLFSVSFLQGYAVELPSNKELSALS